MIYLWFTALARVRARRQIERQNILAQLSLDAFDALIARAAQEKPSAQILPFPKRGRYAA